MLAIDRNESYMLLIYFVKDGKDDVGDSSF